MTIYNSSFLDSTIKRLKTEKKIYIEKDVIKLTPEGREYAITSYEEIAGN